MNSTCKDCKDGSCAVMHLDDKQLELLADNNTEVSFEKGETLFKQNSLTSHVIYVKSGLIKLHLLGPSKREQILKIAKSGVYLGIQSIIGGRVNNFSATAINKVTTCFIDVAIFKKLLFLNPLFTYHILECVCQEGLCQIHKFVNQSQKQLAGKLAEALLTFTNEIFNSNEFELPISRQDLANLIGTTRESTISMLQEFKNDGVLEVQAKKFKILDKAKLENICLKG